MVPEVGSKGAVAVVELFLAKEDAKGRSGVVEDEGEGRGAGDVLNYFVT